MKGQAFATRLGYALAGLRAAWRLEASLRTHAAACVAVLALLALSHAPALWWAVMALTVGAVVSTELLNTAIEALADHLHPGQHPAIGLCKDVAAGAVLVSTLAALAVGAAFLIGHVLPWLHGLGRPG
ncbi:MAG: diacylglycerol kinase [Proteobacteria bacterium]|uniref:diacylglycerol kinase n=1 Tax=Aquabacterium sp. TaxID=1872578 RepID=UPI0035C6CF09|nr:diacylglycerol kinase [Pseudomonadota bacterium]